MISAFLLRIKHRICYPFGTKLNNIQKSDKELRAVLDSFSFVWEQRKAEELCSISTGKSNAQDRIKDGVYPFYVRSPIIERSNRYLFNKEAVLTVGDGVGAGQVFDYVT